MEIEIVVGEEKGAVVSVEVEYFHSRGSRRQETV